jgi:enoyl-CoA hydratase
MNDTVSLPSPTPHLVAEKQGMVGRLTFNRPEMMNAVNMEMWSTIPDLIQAFDDDDDVRVLVLTGAGGRAFVAGADISQFAENRKDAAKAAEYERTNAAAFAAIRRAAKPTIAMIRGYCIGGGMAIALSCDLRIAAHGSTFGIPAAKLGLAYPVDGMAQVLRTVTPSFAKEIFFTARRFDHDEAIAMGLINRAVPDGDLESTVQATCEQICANAPLTLRAAKLTINAIAQAPESYDRAAIEAASRDCFDSEDYQEGQAAFMEKRKPVFRGH